MKERCEGFIDYSRSKWFDQRRKWQTTLPLLIYPIDITYQRYSVTNCPADSGVIQHDTITTLLCTEYQNTAILPYENDEM